MGLRGWVGLWKGGGAKRRGEWAGLRGWEGGAEEGVGLRSRVGGVGAGLEGSFYGEGRS